MKKLVLVLAALSLVATGAFATGFGISYIQSGFLKGPAVAFEPIPLLTLEAGFNVASMYVNTPEVTLKTKEWTAPATEPAWTIRDVSMPDTMIVSACSGTVGMRGLFNLQRPNPYSKFYVGAGLNLVRVGFNINYYEEGTAGPSDSVRLKGSIGAWAFQGVALTGAEFSFKDFPNLGIRAEMGYGLAFLGKITGLLEETFDATDHAKVEASLATKANWGSTYATLGAIWHF